MFPIYGGKCLSRKAFYKQVEKHGKRFTNDEEVETEVPKWLEPTVKSLLCCGFQRTCNVMGQVYQCWWKIS
jgi:hypothetical protein